MVQVVNQNVEILVNDKPIKKYVHENRVYIEAREGCEYQIKLKNDDLSRVLAICSVDGLNVINGEQATPESPGYIIGGKSAYTVRGFRTSDDVVHPFVFSKKEESYAALSDVTQNTGSCGVVGVQFFREKNKHMEDIWKKIAEIEKNKKDKNDNWGDNWPSYPYPYPKYPDPFQPKPYDWDIVWTKTNTTSDNYPYYGDLKCGGLKGECDNSIHTYHCNNIVPNSGELKCSNVEFDMGTKFSNKEIKDEVKEESFEQEDVYCCFMEIFYASKETLEKIGIKFDSKPIISYPSSFTSSKYCKPPKKK